MSIFHKVISLWKKGLRKQEGCLVKAPFVRRGADGKKGKEGWHTREIPQEYKQDLLIETRGKANADL